MPEMLELLFFKEDGRRKGILLHLFKALEHASNKVTGHEDHRELTVELVIAPPDGIVLSIKVFPEPLDGVILVVVGVEPLPFLQVKGALGKSCKRVLGLRLLGHTIILLLSSGSRLLFLLLRFLLGLLLLLLVALARELCKLLSIKLSLLGTKNHLSQNSLGIGLIHHCCEPPVDVAKGAPECRVHHLLVETEKGAGHSNVSQGDPLTNQEGLSQQVVVEGLQNSLDVLLSSLCSVLVKLHDAHGGEDPGAGSRQDVTVSHAHPLHHLCSGSGVTASSQLLIGDIVGNGIAFS